MFESDSAEDEITFDGLCDIYVETGSFSSPSELHGQLCGQLSAGQCMEMPEWIDVAVEQMVIDVSLSKKAEQYLEGLYLFTYEQLLSPDMSFVLLLPDDNEPVNIRIESLSQWCRGFLVGYGLGGIGQSGLSEEVQSILMDFIRIVKVDTDIDEDEVDNEAENDFMEVCEYVRMAVLTLFDEKRMLH